LKSEISRHAILHGADVKYGTASNSLKTILCFDFLQDAFRLVSLRRGKAFHVVGCPTIYSKKGEKDLIFYKYFFQAEEEGRIPCKVCRPKEKEPS